MLRSPGMVRSRLKRHFAAISLGSAVELWPLLWCFGLLLPGLLLAIAAGNWSRQVDRPFGRQLKDRGAVLLKAGRGAILAVASRTSLWE